MGDKTPKSVRVRTGEGNEYRFDAIQQAANLYDVNRSDAVAYACEDAVKLRVAVRKVLANEELALSVEDRCWIAQQFSVGACDVDPFPFVDTGE